jgi:hypothetical protein
MIFLLCERGKERERKREGREGGGEREETERTARDRAIYGVFLF